MVSTDGGATWKPVYGTVNGAAIPRDASDQPALTGTLDGYADLVHPLDACAGQKIKLRFRCTTGTGVAKKGFTADDLAITADGSAVFIRLLRQSKNGSVLTVAVRPSR